MSSGFSFSQLCFLEGLAFFSNSPLNCGNKIPIKSYTIICLFLPSSAKKVSSSRVINNPTLPRNEGFPQKWEFQYSNQESLGQAGMMITLSSSPTLYQCSSAACKKPLKTLLELSLRQLYKSISGFLSETFHFYGSWSILDTGEFYKLVTFFGLIEERRNLFPLVLDSPKLLGFMNISHCK